MSYYSHNHTPPPLSTSSSGRTASGGSGSLRPPRLPSSYRRTFESHRTHSGVDLDTFDIPSPLLSPSSRTSYSSSSSGSEDKVTTTTRRHQHAPPPKNPNDNLPDLGEIDLADGKNSTRPQTFKATIHFNRKHRKQDPEVDNGENDYEWYNPTFRDRSRS